MIDQNLLLQSISLISDKVGQAGEFVYKVALLKEYSMDIFFCIVSVMISILFYIFSRVSMDEHLKEENRVSDYNSKEEELYKNTNYIHRPEEQDGTLAAAWVFCIALCVIFMVGALYSATRLISAKYDALERIVNVARDK